MYQLQLEKKDLTIERDMAQDELTDTQVQLGETDTQLANVVEEKNGKTRGLIADLLFNASNMVNSLLLL